MVSRILAGFVAACLIVWLPFDRCAAGVRAWDAGGDGVFWDHNCNWSGPEDNGVCFGFQPFDGDDVIVPSGNPVVRFLEGINTLDADPGVSIAQNSVLTVHN